MKKLRERPRECKAVLGRLRDGLMRQARLNAHLDYQVDPSLPAPEVFERPGWKVLWAEEVEVLGDPPDPGVGPGDVRRQQQHPAQVGDAQPGPGLIDQFAAQVFDGQFADPTFLVLEPHEATILTRRVGAQRRRDLGEKCERNRTRRRTAWRNLARVRCTSVQYWVTVSSSGASGANTPASARVASAVVAAPG